MGAVKISIGIPTFGQVNIETMLSVIYMIGNMPNYQFRFEFHKGTYLQELRNNIVAEALKNESDYLFFLDSDLTFQSDGLLKLLSHKKEIIGGAYNMKMLPLTSTIKMADANGKLMKMLEHPVEDIFKVYSVPTGFMLIDLHAIKDMIHPFDFARGPEGGLIGEDVNFCKRCREELGLEIWCDPTIRIGHIGEYLY